MKLVCSEKHLECAQLSFALFVNYIVLPEFHVPCKSRCSIGLRPRLLPLLARPVHAQAASLECLKIERM